MSKQVFTAPEAQQIMAEAEKMAAAKQAAADEAAERRQQAEAAAAAWDVETFPAWRAKMEAHAAQCQALRDALALLDQNLRDLPARINAVSRQVIQDMEVATAARLELPDVTRQNKQMIREEFRDALVEGLVLRVGIPDALREHWRRLGATVSGPVIDL